MIKRFSPLALIFSFLCDPCMAVIAIVDSGAAHAVGKTTIAGDVTTPAINTTGATLVIGAMSGLVGATVGDGGLNTSFNYLTTYTNTGCIKMWYLENPNTSTTHQFATISGQYEAMAVAAFSGTLTASSLRDSNGNTATAATISPGNAGASGDLIFTGVEGNFFVASGIGGSFTILDSVANIPPSANFSITSAWKIATGVENPLWTMSASDTLASAIASFKDGGGAGVSTPLVTPPFWFMRR